MGWVQRATRVWVESRRCWTALGGRVEMAEAGPGSGIPQLCGFGQLI